MMKKSYWLVSVWLAAAIVVASEPEDSLLGAWVNQADANDTLKFLGNGIGEGHQYFACTFPATNKVALNYGAGNTETFTLAFVNGDLHLTDTAQNTKVYVRTSGVTGCGRALKQIAGAKALFALDHPDNPEPGIGDLMAYLTALPSCPDGGYFMINPIGKNPTCSIHGEQN